MKHPIKFCFSSSMIDKLVQNIPSSTNGIYCVRFLAHTKIVSPKLIITNFAKGIIWRGLDDKLSSKSIPAITS
jgi:hypothetical protein